MRRYSEGEGERVGRISEQEETLVNLGRGLGVVGWFEVADYLLWTDRARPSGLGGSAHKGSPILSLLHCITPDREDSKDHAPRRLPIKGTTFTYLSYGNSGKQGAARKGVARLSR